VVFRFFAGWLIIASIQGLLGGWGRWVFTRLFARFVVFLVVLAILMTLAYLLGLI
jgi:hypothetical protein